MEYISISVKFALEKELNGRLIEFLIEICLNLCSFKWFCMPGKFFETCLVLIPLTKDEFLEKLFSINIYPYISISDGDGIGLNFQGDDLF